MQGCPRDDRPSAERTLEGHLVFHDGLRQWFALELDRPECGERAVELTADDALVRDLHAAAGCRVRMTGPIAYSPTGYYSLALFQHASRIAPAPGCTLRPRPAKAPPPPPDPRVDRYRIALRVDYRPGDHPVVFGVTAGRRLLHPARSYANYRLTGGLVLYGRCAEGFAVSQVSGPPAARPGHFDEPGSAADMAMYDPESAAAAGHAVLDLGYTCARTFPRARRPRNGGAR